MLRLFILKGIVVDESNVYNFTSHVNHLHNSITYMALISSSAMSYNMHPRRLRKYKFYKLQMNIRSYERDACHTILTEHTWISFEHL